MRRVYSRYSAVRGKRFFFVVVDSYCRVCRTTTRDVGDLKVPKPPTSRRAAAAAVAEFTTYIIHIYIYITCGIRALSSLVKRLPRRAYYTCIIYKYLPETPRGRPFCCHRVVGVANRVRRAAPSRGAEKRLGRYSLEQYNNIIIIRICTPRFHRNR